MHLMNYNIGYRNQAALIFRAVGFGIGRLSPASLMTADAELDTDIRRVDR